MKNCLLSMLLLTTLSAFAQTSMKKIQADICIYGGSSAGVIAAYTASMQNKKVVLIEPGQRLGGLSSGGLGFTDIGNKYVVTGIARDFYRRIGQYYGKFEQWIFEPKVAESIFLEYIRKSGTRVIYGHRLQSVRKNATQIAEIILESTGGEDKPALVVQARQYIDCSYEGDLMARSGVSYTTGREPNDLYQETVNGVQMKHEHQFPDGVDPYRIAGQPQSGLLWGISPDSLAPEGSGDKKIQAYNFRICLSSDPGNKLPIERPENYDSSKYELLLRYLSVAPTEKLGKILKMDLMPNHKTDINNNGPFSTDMIGMNYAYPDGDYATRERIIRRHLDYTKGLLYFIGHDPRMPARLREQMLQWGYPKDEYPQSGHFTPQLYIREARRMLGAYIMTQANCQAREVVKDGIGMAAYNMDSHNAQRVVWNGMVKNEGDVQIRGIRPYPIAYRSITPRKNECSNLLVPVCLSASHMAYGSIRMEPVFMVLAQSAALAASMAADQSIAVQDIDIAALQQVLKKDPLADGSTPEILVDDIQVSRKTGSWTLEAHGGYGPSFLKNHSPEPAAIRFEPEIKKAGTYQLYFYYPKMKNASDEISITVAAGSQKQVKTIRNADIRITGQASGEWVPLGTYRLVAGTKNFVEISNQGANGAVAADAVLFVPAPEK
ncbi:FAD-dependent oxidoreductase [Niabella terrae]